MSLCSGHCKKMFLWSKLTVALSYRHKHSYIEGHFMGTSYSFSKTTVVASVLRPIRSPAEGSTWFPAPAEFMSSCRGDTSANQKAGGWLPGNTLTITTLVASCCPVGHYCCTQGPQLVRLLMAIICSSSGLFYALFYA